MSVLHWSRRLGRRILQLVAALFVGAILALLAVAFHTVSGMPETSLWHDPASMRDFRARDEGTGFAGLMTKERQLFARLEKGISARAEQLAEDGLDRSGQYDRYLPSSPSNSRTHEKDWNRTFVFEVPEPRGAALLLHGLSDSPYSLRAVGEVLRDEGFQVLGLRVPGHGTIPGALRIARWEDWMAAVRVAARQIVAAAGAGKPLVVVGYSNGGALAVEYALSALDREDLTRPELLILLAPAVGVSPVQSLARFQRQISRFPGLAKLAWTSIFPEYDPYKYNSFPVFAGEQLNELTSGLDAQLAERAAAGTLGGFPKVVAFQSLVDATLPPALVVERLLARLPEGKGELVLFDLNRLAAAEEFLAYDYDEALRGLMDWPTLSFDLTVVSNESRDSGALVARTRRVGVPAVPESWTVDPLGLSWPRGMYSLSHVAMPFRPDDPIYGLGGEDDDPRNLRLGRLEPRGERGVLAVPVDQLMRLRFNPFFSYVERRIVAALEGDPI